MENYLQVLKESLEKKVEVLKKVYKHNEEEFKMFSEGKASLDDFDKYLEEKDAMTVEISKLDEGFELLYERVGAQLKENKDQYAEEIRCLQELIKQVTALSVTIQAQETRNAKLVEKFLNEQRVEIHEKRQRSKVAYSYYRSMSSGGETGGIWDSKK